MPSKPWRGVVPEITYQRPVGTFEYLFGAPPQDRTVVLDKFNNPIWKALVNSRLAPSIKCLPEGAISAAEASRIVTGVTWFDLKDHKVAELSGISVPFSVFQEGVTNTNSEERYPFFVSLLDGDVSVAGSAKGDYDLEVGEGGNAAVKGESGDDHLYIWHQKNVVFDGGGGVDTIEFGYYEGFADLSALPTGAVVDLTKGNGTNPFGGTLKVKHVENVAGVFDKNNDLRGDKHDNFLLGGTAVDKLRGEGGDDTIHVKYWTSSAARPMTADGDKGHDTLQVELSDAPAAPFTGSGFNLLAINTLDLLDPSKNTGTFHGGIFKGFEVIQALGSGSEQFVFHGSNKGESVTGGGAGDIIDGRGGKDLLDGGYGNDTLTGGDGKDTFFFRVRPDAGNRDTVTDFAAGDRIQLDGSTFNVEGKGKHGTGELAAKFFAAGTAAHDKDDFILYDKASGNLFWDPDGNGNSFAPVQIAHFNGGPSLSAHDMIAG